MKALLILLCCACAASAAPRPHDCLSTKTVRYGKTSEIIVAVYRHSESQVKITIEDKINNQPKIVDVDPGEGVFQIQVQVRKGWSVTITKDGKIIDRETAMRKTGLGRIPRL